MQNAKDSFYEAMRSRLAALNPERTVVVRAVTRPGVLTDENETTGSGRLTDCFHLRWTAMEVDCNGALPLGALTCEITYTTNGSGLGGGLDRGRLLSTMDSELLQLLTQPSQTAPKLCYAGLSTGDPAMAMRCGIWWSAPTFGGATQTHEGLSRTATVHVMSFQEEGEQ